MNYPKLNNFVSFWLIKIGIEMGLVFFMYQLDQHPEDQGVILYLSGLNMMAAILNKEQ